MYSMQPEFSPESGMPPDHTRKHSLSPNISPNVREKHQKIHRHASSPTPLDKNKSACGNRSYLRTETGLNSSSSRLCVESSEQENSLNYVSTPKAAAVGRSNSRNYEYVSYIIESMVIPACYLTSVADRVICTLFNQIFLHL